LFPMKLSLSQFLQVATLISTNEYWFTAGERDFIANRILRVEGCIALEQGVGGKKQECDVAAYVKELCVAILLGSTDEQKPAYSDYCRAKSAVADIMNLAGVPRSQITGKSLMDVFMLIEPRASNGLRTVGGKERYTNPAINHPFAGFTAPRTEGTPAVLEAWSLYSALSDFCTPESEEGKHNDNAQDTRQVLGDVLKIITPIHQKRQSLLLIKAIQKNLRAPPPLVKVDCAQTNVTVPISNHEPGTAYVCFRISTCMPEGAVEMDVTADGAGAARPL
jgi:hypothetical protein